MLVVEENFFPQLRSFFVCPADFLNVQVDVSFLIALAMAIAAVVTQDFARSFRNQDRIAVSIGDAMWQRASE